ncbi:flavoprotein [Nonomuraea sp. NPDC050663]|uniref:flavoprotein n=1 Tax=Nonomuraea sp. NPDC050663 TaxID=3364370 RepID=UPI0037A529A9
MSKVLCVNVCAAGPAREVGRLVELVRAEGWTVQIVATPSALAFIDVPALEEQTSRPARSQYRKPDEPKSPRADAIIVAPATFNTINKFAHGVADTYALGVLSEAPGLEIPVVVLPFVNCALANREPFRESMGSLQRDGVRVLFGPGEFEPHPPSTSEERLDIYPWQLALAAVDSRVR